MNTPTVLPSTMPRSTSAFAVSSLYLAMSSTSSSGLSAPACAYCAIWPGPGRPARSGRTPEATPVVRIWLMSRVPVYLTLLPVCCSQGATIARKFFCSSPPHVPMTLTVLPLPPLLLGLEHAANTRAAAPSTPATRRHGVLDWCIRLSFSRDRGPSAAQLLLCPPTTGYADSGTGPGRVRSGRGRGRRADDELGRKEGPVRQRPAGHPVEQCRAGGEPQVERRQPDGGERRVKERRQGDVVEADHRDVVGDPEARLADRCDRPERDDVAGHERRVDRALREQLGHRRVAAARVERGLRDERLVVGDPGGLERGPVAVAPFLGRGVRQRRVRDAGDPAPAQADQVLDRPPGAAHVV